MEPIRDLQSLLGPSAVLHDTADVAPFLTDWRGRYTGRTLAVVQPRSTAEVCQVVLWCARNGVPLVPQGGNTGLVGGATPDERGNSLVLSTRRLRRIRSLDTANDTITVEAGCLLHEVQQAALAHDRLFPLSLASQGSCTIGGNLATNAGGTQVLRYGNARDLALGLEVVLADGALWDGLRGLRKDNSGYDLKQLFVGSEGTLGIITAATLRLFPVPRARVVCLLGCADLAATIDVLARARAQAGPALTAFEVMSADCLRLLQGMPTPPRPLFSRAHAWLVLLEWSEPVDGVHAQEQCERLCAAALAAGEAQDAIVSRSHGDALSLWQVRESIPEAQARRGGNVKHDISLPVGAMPAFLAEAEAALAQLSPDLQTLVFGHLGDGNLHFNVAAREGVPAAAAFEREAQINAIVYPAVGRHGGSISAEHGLGQLRRDLAQRVKPEREMAMMRAIKQALDPRGLMNPGKLI